MPTPPRCTELIVYRQLTPHSRILLDSPSRDIPNLFWLPRVHYCAEFYIPYYLQVMTFETQGKEENILTPLLLANSSWRLRRFWSDVRIALRFRTAAYGFSLSIARVLVSGFSFFTLRFCFLKDFCTSLQEQNFLH